MKNHVQEGDYIEITAGANISAGQLVQYGSLHGVAVADIANGAKGIISLEGVYTLPKLTAAAGDATTAGGLVYFDGSGNVSGTDASGTRLPVGHSLAVAAQAATTVNVRLAN